MYVGPSLFVHLGFTRLTQLFAQSCSRRGWGRRLPCDPDREVAGLQGRSLSLALIVRDGFALTSASQVIATASSADKLKICTELGKADFGVDYTKEGWQKEVLKITGGRGVDVVFDPVGRSPFSLSSNVVPC